MSSGVAPLRLCRLSLRTEGYIPPYPLIRPLPTIFIIYSANIFDLKTILCIITLPSARVDATPQEQIDE